MATLENIGGELNMLKCYHEVGRLAHCETCINTIDPPPKYLVFIAPQKAHKIKTFYKLRILSTSSQDHQYILLLALYSLILSMILKSIIQFYHTLALMSTLKSK